jgi:Gal80p, C-terminal domain
VLTGLDGRYDRPVMVGHLHGDCDEVDIGMLRQLLWIGQGQRDSEMPCRYPFPFPVQGVCHAVGLQGQLSPTINYVKDLIADGYVGRVLAATMIGCAPNWGATLDRAFQADFANGANLMTITGGHQIDALSIAWASSASWPPSP